jgi:hypothetical protein
MLKAVKAKCRDCMGNFKDGRKDCRVRACSLYHWMPYRKSEPDLAWLKKTQSEPQEALAAASADHEP